MEKEDLVRRGHETEPHPGSTSRGTHTVGPWAVVANKAEWGYGPHEVSNDLIQSEETELYVAAVLSDVPESKANARLIAAAPDLLAALRGAEQAISDALAVRHETNKVARIARTLAVNEWVKQLREAIAKASA